MKKILVIRHAKSSWGDPALADHDRPLNSRGRKAAPVIAAWLAANGHVPDTVLCSSSVRTRQTVERMRRRMPDLPVPRIEPALYEAAPATILGLLRALPRDCATVMLVAHQPGVGGLVRLLADGSEGSSCSRAFEHFPTAAAAILEVDLEDWAALDRAAARFVEFAMPRELADD